jgi:hypothetical protein
MTHYLHTPDGVFLKSDDQLKAVDRQLAPGVYSVNILPTGEYYLKQIDEFTRPPKMYGDTTANAARIFNTFRSRPSTTGVLLTGEKGSGKTMLARELSILAREAGMPTIVVGFAFHGPNFNEFIQRISCEAVVLLDEFEKTYDRDEQASMLTLLDGLFPTKKLFVLTCNDEFRVDQHMHNRPGRLYYAIRFEGLGQDFIHDYCQDVLLNKEHIEGVQRIASLFGKFNFDMLKALVEEMNRYGETAHDAVRLLNARPQLHDGSEYKVELVVDGVRLEEEDADGTDLFWPTELDRNPMMMTSGLRVTQYVPDEGKPNIQHHFSLDDLVQMDVSAGRFVFQQGNVTVTLRRKPPVTFSYDRFNAL